MKMTKNLMINGRSIRYDRGCYCLEDMYNAYFCPPPKIRVWVEQQGIKDRVVCKGFMIKTTWAALPDVIAYADHLGIGDSVRKQFGMKTLAEQKAERERVNVVTRRETQRDTPPDDPLLNAAMFGVILNDPSPVRIIQNDPIPTHRHDNHSTNHRDTDFSRHSASETYSSKGYESHSNHNHGSSHSHDHSSHSSHDHGSSYDSSSPSGGDSW
jgi:hypothetical protein